MEAIDGVAVIEAPSRDHWRAWLEDNCTSVRSVWLRIFRQGSSTPNVRFHDAIEDALCFGWVDARRSSAIRRAATCCSAPETRRTRGVGSTGSAPRR
jgi:uncharacterized protein YdeI (YjbR/CyaY-like superfamily)